MGEVNHARGEKLAALIPPPRIHLTRFFGCLAPHAKIRSQIVPKSTSEETAAQSVDASGRYSKTYSPHGLGRTPRPSFYHRHEELPEVSGRTQNCRSDCGSNRDPKNSRALGPSRQASRYFAGKATPANEFHLNVPGMQRESRSHVRCPQKHSFKIQLLDPRS